MNDSKELLSKLLKVESQLKETHKKVAQFTHWMAKKENADIVARWIIDNKLLFKIK